MNPLDFINKSIIYYLKFESVSDFQACINFEKNQWPLVNVVV